MHKVLIKQKPHWQIVLGMLVYYQRSCLVYLQVLVKLVKHFFQRKGKIERNFLKNELISVFCLISFFDGNENSKPERHYHVIFLGYRYE